MRTPPISLYLFTALAACSTPPEVARLQELQASHFPGAASLLAGLAAADDDPAMRIGDAALLGLEFRRSATIERQLLLLEVVDLPWQSAANGSQRVRQSTRVTIPGSPRHPADGTTIEPRSLDVHALRLRLTRCDAAGQRLRTSEVMAFEEPLAVGWWPYAAPPRELRTADLAAALTMSLQELAGRDAVLQELLFRFVDEPSLWSVATHLGLRIELRWADGPRPTRIVAIEDPTGLGEQVRSTSLELLVNGDPASRVTLLVTKPRGASRVCGGLVGAIAQHATDPERLAIVRLLAMRRGAWPVTR